MAKRTSLATSGRRRRTCRRMIRRLLLKSSQLADGGLEIVSRPQLHHILVFQFHVHHDIGDVHMLCVKLLFQLIS